MLQVSTEPVSGGRKVLNKGFGNRCVICGGWFDEGGICDHGHEWGKTYCVLSDRTGTKPRKVIPLRRKRSP